MPVISAMVDGEATPKQILELRPHLRNCPGCRATLKALRDTSEPLTAVLPIPLVAAATGGAEHISNLFLRAYEAIAGGLHERAVHSVTKAQAAMEAAAAGKVAAVAASAAAVAGGGYATVERTVRDEPSRTVSARELDRRSGAKRPAVSTTVGSVARPSMPKIARQPQPVRSAVNEFGQRRAAPSASASTEFDFDATGAPTRAISASASTAIKAPKKPNTPVRNVPPEFESAGGADEFGP